MARSDATRDQRRQRCRHDRRRPQVEAAEHDGPEQERRERREGERGPHAGSGSLQRPQDDGHRADGERAADPHQGLEGPAKAVGHLLIVPRLGEAGQREHRQRAGRIFDREVAIRDFAVRDQIPVVLVDRGVEDLLVPVEADVEQRPRDDKECDRREGRSDDRPIRGSRVTGRGHLLPERRTRRRGRTRECRDRTNA